MYRLVALLADLLCRTLRIEKSGDGPLREALASGKPGIILFWHGSMFVGWWWLRRRGLAALVSRSRDGERLGAVLRAWGYALIRGSSSRGGKEAMESMAAAVQAGRFLCITPDGPRGPRGVMKIGAVVTAQRTGVPVFLLSIVLRRRKALRSWDAFALPLPFTRCTVTVSEPIDVDPSLDFDGTEAARARIELRLHRMDTDAAARLGGAPAAGAAEAR